MLEQDTTGASIVSQVASLCGQVDVLEEEEKEDLLGMTFAVGNRPSSRRRTVKKKKKVFLANMKVK